MVQLTLEQINNIDIVDFLASLNYHPVSIEANIYSYISMLPGRSEAIPSFKVNRTFNRWKDSGMNSDSTLVDFGILYFNCTIRELLITLSQHINSLQNVPQHNPLIQSPDTPPIEILKTYPIRSFYLIRYLWERRIPVIVAQQYCVEVEYTFGPRPYYALGFRCDAGGYELYNKYHHYSTSPQSSTLISQPAKDVAVFPDFFDMLSFVSFINTPIIDLPDFLVLNSVSSIESLLPLVKNYRRKHLFLANTPIGDTFTQLALAGKAGWLDHRSLYKGYRNLNTWVCDFGKASIPCVENLPVTVPSDP